MTTDARAGFTLQELMIAVALVAVILVSLILGNYKNHLVRTHDLRRKSDVANLSRALDEYHDDKQCYPDPSVIADCGTGGLAPYLKLIPCDPGTNTPYNFFLENPDNSCFSPYRICTHLQDARDMAILDIGCSPVNGCGWGDEWNYCVASGTTVTPDGFVPMPTATPIP